MLDQWIMDAKVNDDVVLHGVPQVSLTVVGS